MSRLLLVATALALFVTPVTAQQPSVRQGFWYGFGFGVGSGKLHCEICNDQSTTDLTASIRAGGVLSKSWLLGVELDGWTNSQDVGTRRSWSASAITLWYPWTTNTLYAKGGLGFTGYRASDSVDVFTVTRPGLTIGIGYEWRVGKKSSINPYINYQHSLAGDLKLEHTENNTVTTSVVATDASISSIQFGVGLVIH